ncbi:MAG: NUDIX hydrolase [Candidatus Aquicultorales bacterium]
MSDKGHETLSREEIYSGTLLSLYRETVKPPDGPPHAREVVRGVRASAVAAFTAEDGVVLIRQYRQPIGDIIYELPAGLIDPGEDAREAAARELTEETGYVASEFEHLADIFTTPGYSDEVLSIFLATGLTPGDASPEEDETFEVAVVSFEKALEMIDEGEIRDAKTIAGLLLAGRARSGR